MVPSSGAGFMQVKCCFSLILTNRQSRTNENRIYWKASTKSTQDQLRTLAFGILPLSDKEVIYLQQPVPLWSRAEPSLPYQAARWLWRRRTTNTLLPSAGHHKETLLDLRAKSLLSLTAWDFQLCIVWTLPTWDQQQKRKSKGLFYDRCLFVCLLVWSGGGMAFRVALTGQVIGLLSCLLFARTRMSCSETVSSLMAISEKLKS